MEPDSGSKDGLMVVMRLPKCGGGILLLLRLLLRLLPVVYWVPGAALDGDAPLENGVAVAVGECRCSGCSSNRTDLMAWLVGMLLAWHSRKC